MGDRFDRSRPLFTDTFTGRFLGSLAVLGAVLAIVAGLPLLNSMIPGIVDLSGNRIDLGHGVSFVAPEGTTRDVGRDRLLGGKTELNVNGAIVAATARPYDDTDAALAGAIDGELKAQPGIQLAGEETVFTTRDGVVGLRHVFRSPSSEGYFIVFVHEGVGVDVIVSSSTRRGLDEVTYDRLEDALATMRFEGSRP
ncbi:hypothetical protein AB0I28_28440 [Phytomonospora sp. NPDC050363]|uniref:hypothetical protein n=1 Tax=Phytomonospora sp. NPDC050363 TaxID=3155642 RepID=UPI0033E7BAE9